MLYEVITGAAVTSYRLEGLRDAIEVEEAAKSPDLDIAHELLLLKQGDGLYHESEADVTAPVTM